MTRVIKEDFMSVGSGYGSDGGAVLVAPMTAYARPWRVAVIAGLASFVDGAALSANGFGLVIYQQTLGLTAGEVGLLTAVVTLGLAIGAVVGGRLGDLFGRRKVFVVTMAMIVLGSLGPTFGTSFGVLFAGLALMGLGVGADMPVALATIAEAASDKNRGAMLVFTQILWVSASVLVVVITTVTGGAGRAAAQVLYGMVAVVGLIGLLLRLTVPESPLWLASREERRSGVHTVRADKAQVRDLLRTPLRRPFLVLTAYYTLVSIAAGVAVQYAVYIAVNVAGVSIEEFSPYTLLSFPVVFIALGLFMKFVDTRYRMPLFLAGGVLMTVAFLIPAVFGSTLLTLVLVLALGSLGNVTCGETIARVWGNESFPTLLRSTGQGIVYTVARLGLVLAAAVGPAVIAMSPGWFFVGCAAIGLVGVLIGWFGFRGGRAVNEFQHEQEPDSDFAAPAAG
jgi:inositol transporter-like SP family MFS transporter